MVCLQKKIMYFKKQKLYLTFSLFLVIFSNLLFAYPKNLEFIKNYQVTENKVQILIDNSQEANKSILFPKNYNPLKTYQKNETYNNLVAGVNLSELNIEDKIFYKNTIGQNDFKIAELKNISCQKTNNALLTHGYFIGYVKDLVGYDNLENILCSDNLENIDNKVQVSIYTANYLRWLFGKNITQESSFFDYTKHKLQEILVTQSNLKVDLIFLLDLSKQNDFSYKENISANEINNIKISNKNFSLADGLFFIDLSLKKYKNKEVIYIFNPNLIVFLNSKNEIYSHESEIENILNKNSKKEHITANFIDYLQKQNLAKKPFFTSLNLNLISQEQIFSSYNFLKNSSFLESTLTLKNIEIPFEQSKIILDSQALTKSKTQQNKLSKKEFEYQEIYFLSNTKLKDYNLRKFKSVKGELFDQNDINFLASDLQTKPFFSQQNINKTEVFAGGLYNILEKQQEKKIYLLAENKATILDENNLYKDFSKSKLEEFFLANSTIEIKKKLINYKNINIKKSNSHSFKFEYIDKNKVLFLPSATGKLHVILDENTKSKELYSVIQSNFLKKYFQEKNKNTKSNKNIFYKATHYFYDKNNDKKVDPKDDKLILFFAHGYGDKSYSAYDFSDYKNPKYLWQLSHKNIPELGFTTSAARIINLKNEDYLLLSSGQNLTQKNYFYLVDILSAKILKKIFSPSENLVGDLVLDEEAKSFTKAYFVDEKANAWLLKYENDFFSLINIAKTKNLKINSYSSLNLLKINQNEKYLAFATNDLYKAKKSAQIILLKMQNENGVSINIDSLTQNPNKKGSCLIKIKNAEVFSKIQNINNNLFVFKTYLTQNPKTTLLLDYKKELIKFKICQENTIQNLATNLPHFIDSSFFSLTSNDTNNSFENNFVLKNGAKHIQLCTADECDSKKLNLTSNLVTYFENN